MHTLASIMIMTLSAFLASTFAKKNQMSNNKIAHLHLQTNKNTKEILKILNDRL